MYIYVITNFPQWPCDVIYTSWSNSQKSGWKIKTSSYSDQVGFSRKTNTIELTLLLGYIAKICVLFLIIFNCSMVFHKTAWWAKSWLLFTVSTSLSTFFTNIFRISDNTTFLEFLFFQLLENSEGKWWPRSLSNISAAVTLVSVLLRLPLSRHCFNIKEYIWQKTSNEL